MTYLAGAVTVLTCVLVLEFCSDAALVDWIADAFVFLRGGRKAVIQVRTMRADHRYRRALRRLRCQLAAAKDPREAGAQPSKVITVTSRRGR